jgi:hypothetical protein
VSEHAASGLINRDVKAGCEAELECVVESLLHLVASGGVRRSAAKPSRCLGNRKAAIRQRQLLAEVV